MTDPLPLQGKTALITGASRGLGAVIARHLAAGGANLILTARDKRALEAVALPIDSREVRTHAINLADPEQVDQLIEFCREDESATVDILVNNAAILGPIGRFDSVEFSQWQNVIQVNFLAAARLCQGLIPSMRQKGHGKIINLSGGGAASPRPEFSAYAASKCALVRFSETLAVELNGTGIDVNCLAPGAMNTQMLQQVLDAGPSAAPSEFDKALQQKESGGAPPEKAAELIAFLASPAGDGITGRLISALWDNWQTLPSHRDELRTTDIYTLRRIVPEDRGQKW